MGGGIGVAARWFPWAGKAIVECAVPAALGLVALVFFRDLFLGHRVLVGGDLFTETYPRLEFLRESLREGRIPLWDPYFGLGRPFLADLTNAALYPLSYPVRWVAPEAFVSLSVAFHAALAGWGAYFCSRTFLRTSRLGALGAAVVFGFGGTLAGRADELNFLRAAAWMPLILLAVSGTFRDRSVVWATTTAGLFLVQFLAGDPYVTFVTAVLSGIIAGGFLARDASAPAWSLTVLLGSEGFSRRAGTRALDLVRAVVPVVLLAAYIGAVTVGLAQIQVRPFLELLGESTPVAISTDEEAGFQALAPSDTMLVLLPRYFDRSNLPVAYIGFTATALAGLGIARNFRSPPVWVLVCAGLLGVGFSLGVPAPVQAVFDLFPGNAAFDQPSKWLLVFALAASLLAGLGLDGFVRRTSRWSQRVPVAEIVGALALPLLAIIVLYAFSGGASSLPRPGVLELWIGLAILLFDLVFLLSLRRPVGVVAAGLLAVIVAELVAAATLPGIELHSLVSVSRQTYAGARAAVPRLPDPGMDSRVMVPARATEASLTDSVSLGIGGASVVTGGGDPGLDLVARARRLEGSLASTYRTGAIAAGEPGGRFPLANYASWLRLVSGTAESPVRPLQRNGVEVAELNSIRGLPDANLLSLGAVRFVTAETNERLVLNGVTFDLSLERRLGPGEAVALPSGSNNPVTSVQLITTISSVPGVGAGTPVLEAVSVTSEGEEIRSHLRLGVDTDIGPGNFDVLNAGGLLPGLVTDQRTGEVYGYQSRSAVGLPVRISEVRLRNLLPAGDVQVRAATLVDDRFGISRPLVLDPNYRLVSREDPTVYEVLPARPRIRLVQNARRQMTEDPIAEAAETVDVEGVLLTLDAASQQLLQTSGDTSGAQIELSGPIWGERLSLEVNSPDGGWLVVSDIDYPGWKAKVDGTPVPIVRANGLTRAILVPPGRHAIEMAYQPDSFFSGIDAMLRSLFGITLVLFFASGAQLFRRARDSAPSGAGEGSGATS